MENDLEPLMIANTDRNTRNNIARIWPCGKCSILLGLCHLFIGIFLLIFDIITNNISEIAFAATSSLTFIVCAILAFIASNLKCEIFFRRLDRTSQLLLLFISLFAIALTIIMFIDSVVVINHNCDLNNCYQRKNIIYFVILSISLIELTICLITLFVCFRSLRKAYGVTKARSPYSTLIEGNYQLFKIIPRLFKFFDDINKT
ncbi:unnamed protein product [Dracunculus medinensis]|uniref:MARVEL domain-containing protein n=1 Tax=Dracunculus medinensis TaxID=318479 RepID=A0A0N4UQQ1_DRAME|nr:unnamed protein product [Dracunculus medinensis]